MLRTRSVRHAVCGLVLLTACSGGGDDLDPKTPVRIVTFEVTPASVRAGQAATLTWETTGVNSVSIEPQVGLQPPSGSVEVNPIATTQYTIRIESPGGPLKSTVTVEVTGGPASIDAFTATPQTIMAGQSTILEWATSNATHVMIEPDIGMKPAQGNMAVMPEVTTTYRLTAVGEQGSATAEVRVVVASGNQPFILSFNASPQTAQPGDTVTLTWETQNADSVTIDNQVGIQSPKGTATVQPAETTTYTLTAVGPGGQTTASVTVNVVLGGDPSIISFSATPTTVPAMAPVTLDWETDNATHVTITGFTNTMMAKGSVEVRPNATTTYTLTAHGNGKTATQDVTVTVSAAGAPVVLEFAATPAAIVSGGSTTLTWRTDNATRVDISNGAGAGLMPSGSIQVSPRATTTYTLTARGANATATQMVTVTVQPAPPVVTSFTASPPSITAGQSTTISWQTTDATTVTIDNNVGTQSGVGSVRVQPTTTTVYTLTAMGPGGMTSSMLTVTVTAAGAPSIMSFTGTPQQVSPGTAVLLSWSTSGATAVSIDNGVGTQPTSGSTTVTPAVTTTYTLLAVGPGGMTDAQVTITVASSNGDQCSNAFLINMSGQFTGNTNTAVNDYDPGSGGCTNYSAQGPDIAYRVQLQAGDRLVATLNPTGGAWDTSLYLVRNCSNIATSCVAGQDNGNPETVDYTAAASGDYFLIVDGYRTGGAYTLDVQINTAPIANDTCAGAINVSNGGMFQGTTRGAANDYDPGAGGCTRFAERSGDTAYRVDLQAGERLQASLSTTWDSALYLVSDCSMASATCVAGQDNGNPEEVDFTAPAAGTWFLIVDGFATSAGSYDLAVTVSPPVVGGDMCGSAVPVPAAGGSFQSTTVGLNNDYEPPVSCTGYAQRGPDRVYSSSLTTGDVVEISAQFASTLDGSVYVVTDCSDLTASCTGADRGLRGDSESLRFVARQSGAHYYVVDASGTLAAGTHDLTVARYGGDVCSDAPPLLLGNQPEWFTTAGKTNDYSPNAGGCTGFSASAPDRAYSVQLQAGDQLQVTVNPEAGYDPSVYLVSDCSDVPGSCVAGRDTQGNVTETLAAVVQQAGTYQLILDGFFGSNGAGTLTATIARGDTCDDAYLVPAPGGTFRGTTTGYGADYGITSRTNSCTGWPQVGRDAVYAVELATGQRVQATLTTSWDSALYLVTDCGAAATSCVAGADSGEPETVTYTNSGAPRTFYLVVDSYVGSISGNYTLQVTIN